MRRGTASVRVLFVCTGNICRSPTAEGVFRQLVAAAGLEARIQADSAGTHDYHIGLPPDARTQAAASRRGYDLRGLRARRVAERDFSEFDYILAMDLGNLSDLQRVGSPQYRDKPRLFMEFSAARKGEEVPDPYYGGLQGFERVLDMCEDGAAGLLAHIKKRLGV